MSPREEADAVRLLRRWAEAWERMTAAGHARNGSQAVAIMAELDEKLLPETRAFLRLDDDGESRGNT